jgi:hypothetical protein
MQRFYTAIVEKAKNGFGVFFPDLPGCTSFGRTVEEAAANAYPRCRPMWRCCANMATRFLSRVRLMRSRQRKACRKRRGY